MFVPLGTFWLLLSRFFSVNLDIISMKVEIFM